MPDPITIQRLEPEALARLGEIDRSEIITTGYVYQNGQLTAETVHWDVPAWLTGDDTHPWSVAAHIRQMSASLEQGGALLGALDGERLAGLAILRPDLQPGMAQLAALFVSRPYRRQGVASQLLAEAERLARAGGATSLYVSATPSASAVGFYLEHGFGPTDSPDPALLALEPEDIHMVKPL
jgi:GNAT superfamily N-acetyltransferase